MQHIPKCSKGRENQPWLVVLIFSVQEHHPARPPVPQHLTMAVYHANSDTLIQLPGQGVSEGPHELEVEVLVWVLADDTLVDLHNMVPHPTAPGLGPTPIHMGTVVTHMLMSSGEKSVRCFTLVGPVNCLVLRYIILHLFQPAPAAVATVSYPLLNTDPLAASI